MCMREREKERGREDEGKFSAVNPVLREGNSFIFFRLFFFKVLGSAVNPVLREGNSDRRAAAPVKVCTAFPLKSWCVANVLLKCCTHTHRRAA
jgi:monomeric isocitrate dehydrogenase